MTPVSLSRESVLQRRQAGKPEAAGSGRGVLPGAPQNAGCHLVFSSNNMILYAVIARAKCGTILVEKSAAGVEGNFPQITVEVLERVVSSSNWSSALGTLKSASKVELLPDESRRTFVQRRDGSMSGGMFSGLATQWTCFGYNGTNDVESARGVNNGDVDYYFHLCRKDNVTGVCISDDIDVRYHEVNYSFLDDVVAKFRKSYAAYRITKAKAYEMDKKFSKELEKRMYFYNGNRDKLVRQDKVVDILNKVDDLKDILGKNITMVLERETRLVELVERSDEMLEDTKVFTKRSAKIKKRLKTNHNSYYIIGFVFGVLVLYLFVGDICGYTFQKCLASKDGR